MFWWIPPWLVLISLPLVAPLDQSGIHLPLTRKETRYLRRRDSHTEALGLGDYVDVSYSVLMTVGNGVLPIVLDTGSSDLWVVSDACKACPTNLPAYPQATFNSAGLSVNLEYGDSHTATHAQGKVGTDSVTIGSLSSTKQYFAAITNTNTSVLESGAVGIFGLGFPVNSIIWDKVFAAQNPSLVSGSPTRRYNNDFHDIYPRHIHSSNNYMRPHVPNIARFYSEPLQLSSSHSSMSPGDVTELVLASFSTSGPLISRLVEANFLASPMYTITLQRDVFASGGNAGLISIGSLPNGIQNSSFTWVPLRTYDPTVDKVGLPPPTNSPKEKYPLAWEVFIDDVYLDGKKLPRSTIVSPNITLSSLVDTGNSLIRGPSDVITNILDTIGADKSGVYLCSTPHTLAFSIGGQMFPVDPRDFASQAFQDDTEHCTSNLAPTDPPVEGGGFLYSWSVGDPFLKGVVAAFYFGNITYPSVDSPKMGFFSTVPEDAVAQYITAVQAVQASGQNGNFPAISEPAPSGLFTGAGATQTLESDNPTQSGLKLNRASSSVTWSLFLTGVAIVMAGSLC